jgi:RNA polymerase sigma-70 factor (ECF subfamily)
MDKQLFLRNIHEHNGIIIKIVNMYADDTEDRKDLYQEIIYQSWKAFAAFRMEAKFSTWLYKISLNVSLTFLHKKKAHTKATESISTDEYDSPIELSENADRLYSAIKALNEIERGLIMLHLDGYDNDAISDMIGITKNNAGVRLHRIKQKLTDILKK